MARTYRREEVEEFLKELEFQAREIISVAERAETEADRHSYDLYYQFRDKASQFETFCIIIEQRLHNIDSAKVEDLNQKFDELSILMYTTLIKASIRFFFVLSANPVLPLGAKEIFLSELRSLYNTKKKLADPKYQGLIDEEALQNLEIAEEILNEIIEKAPSLLEFESATPRKFSR